MFEDSTDEDLSEDLLLESAESLSTASSFDELNDDQLPEIPSKVRLRTSSTNKLDEDRLLEFSSKSPIFTPNTSEEDRLLDSSNDDRSSSLSTDHH